MVHAARQQRVQEVAGREKVPEDEAVAAAREVQVVRGVGLALLQQRARHPAPRHAPAATSTLRTSHHMDKFNSCPRTRLAPQNRHGFMAN